VCVCVRNTHIEYAAEYVHTCAHVQDVLLCMYMYMYVYEYDVFIYV